MKSVTHQTCYKMQAAMKNGKQNLLQKSRGVLMSAALFFTLYSTQSLAQGCLVGSLTINTGWDPTTSSVITPTASDPKWTNCGASADMTNDMIASGFGSSGVQADVIPPLGGWVTMASSGYISCFNSNHFASVAGHTYTMTLCRTFTLCKDDCININLQVLSDNWISDIHVDALPPFYSQPAPGGHIANCVNPAQASTNTCIQLTAGTHTISITVNQDAFTEPGNYAGLDVVGTVNSATGTNSIVSESRDCKEYVCPTCVDTCYWTVSGNTIHGGKNIFGTVSNDDIRIISNNINRAVIQAGGFMGIKQLTPSTTLDVDCVPTSAPSGLQFENLPFGHGNALVVDPSGYVYVAQQSILYKQNDNSDLQDQINQLKQQLEAMKAQLSSLGITTDNNSGNSLTATPNPSNGQVNINYTIAAPFTNATIKIVDNLGKLIISRAVNSNNGSENITLPASLASGNLIVTLVVDGKLVAQQKEVLVK